MDMPDYLYHGSMYKQDELMPGFKRSGTITFWDGTESNLNLYTTSDKRAAELLAIGSAVEKEFNSNRFIELKGNIWIYLDELIDIKDLLKLNLYCYTIPFRATDGWTKNNNKYNGIDNEWITRHTVRNITVEKINIKTVMSGKCITITTAPMDTPIHQLLRRYVKETKIYKF